MLGKQERIIPIDIQDEMKTSYMDYSMSVIISRALPDVKDGLKPSQLRILVAMSDLNLSPGRPHRKCAKIAGDTSGNYQIYASMALSGVMASDDIRADFKAGDHYMELNFSGEAIYDSGRNGPYTINISIYTGPQPISYLDYKTSDYKYEDFNPNPTSQITEEASIEVVNNTVRLKTEIFEAVIYELTPKIIFFYSS